MKVVWCPKARDKYGQLMFLRIQKNQLYGSMLQISEKFAFVGGGRPSLNKCITNITALSHPKRFPGGGLFSVSSDPYRQYHK